MISNYLYVFSWVFAKNFMLISECVFFGSQSPWYPGNRVLKAFPCSCVNVAITSTFPYLRILLTLQRPFLARGVSGTAPTIYLRSKSAASAPQPASLRPTVYALQRFAKAQLQTADAADQVSQQTSMRLLSVVVVCIATALCNLLLQAKIEADIARYQSYLDGDLQPLFAQVSEQVAQKKKLIPLLDRYPDMPLEKLPVRVLFLPLCVQAPISCRTRTEFGLPITLTLQEIAEVLQTRLDRAYNILRVLLLFPHVMNGRVVVGYACASESQLIVEIGEIVGVYVCESESQLVVKRDMAPLSFVDPFLPERCRTTN